MEERKEINYSDLDEFFNEHKEALKKIKDFDFTTTSKLDLLNIVKNNMFENLEGQENFELYSSIVVDDNDMPAVSVWAVKHIDWVTSEHYYMLFTPFTVWVRTNTRNIHYKHKKVTKAWCEYLLKKFPLYHIPLIKHLEDERMRLHTQVDAEYDNLIKNYSTLK